MCVANCPALIAHASEIDTTNGKIYLDSGIVPGEIYSYWIRYRSAAGVFGPFNTIFGTISNSLKIGSQQVENLHADNITAGRFTGDRACGQ